jgi:hypothetical protein
MDQPFHGLDLSGEDVELVAQHQQRGAGDLGQGVESAGAHLFEKLRDPARSLRRRQAELGAMSTDGVDQLCALSDQQLAGPVQHQHPLALGALDRHEPHRRSRHSFTDRLGIGSVVLLAAKIGLHIGWRHQPHLMAQCCDLARPMMGGGAGFHPDQAGLERSEEAQNLAAPQLLAGHAAETQRYTPCISGTMKSR